MGHTLLMHQALLAMGSTSTASLSGRKTTTRWTQRYRTILRPWPICNRTACQAPVVISILAWQASKWVTHSMLLATTTTETLFMAESIMARATRAWAYPAPPSSHRWWHRLAVLISGTHRSIWRNAADFLTFEAKVQSISLKFTPSSYLSLVCASRV